MADREGKWARREGKAKGKAEPRKRRDRGGGDGKRRSNASNMEDGLSDASQASSMNSAASEAEEEAPEPQRRGGREERRAGREDKEERRAGREDKEERARPQRSDASDAGGRGGRGERGAGAGSRPVQRAQSSEEEEEEPQEEKPRERRKRGGRDKEGGKDDDGGRDRDRDRDRKEDRGLRPERSDVNGRDSGRASPREDRDSGRARDDPSPRDGGKRGDRGLAVEGDDDGKPGRQGSDRPSPRDSGRPGRDATPAKQDSGRPGREGGKDDGRRDRNGKRRQEQDRELPLLKDDPETRSQGSQRNPYGTASFAALEQAAGGEGMSEAQYVANLRRLLKTELPGEQGPDFAQNVWEYYMVKGTYSDDMCVALNHSSMWCTCLSPCGWPYRLWLTMRRAAPIPVKCGMCTCGLGNLCRAPMMFLIFVLPLLAALTFLPQISAALQATFATLPITSVPPVSDDLPGLTMYFSIFLVASALFLGLVWWARILMGVATKYNIIDAIDKPATNMAKTMCCICAMNQRLGLHVDRAQGFRAAHKLDKQAVLWSDRAGQNFPPHQNVMV